MREAEKASGRKPDPAMDAFLKAQTLEGGDESIVTDYMLKLLGLDVSYQIQTWKSFPQLLLISWTRDPFVTDREGGPISMAILWTELSESISYFLAL